MDTTAHGPDAVRLATAYSSATLEAEAPPAEALPSDEDATWSGVVVVEGTPTGDGRLIEHNALTWKTSKEDPILLRYVRADVGAHDGAEVVGRIYKLERDKKTGNIHARGDFDMGSEIGREAHRQVKENLTRGVSVDLDDVAFEIRVAKDVLEDSMLMPEEDDPDGDDEGSEEMQSEDMEVDEEGRVTVAKVEKDAELFVTTEARIRAATLVATPAFSEAFISVDEDGSDSDSDSSEDEEDDDSDEELSVSPSRRDSLIAAAAPVAPPEAWFSDPKLDGPTGVQVDDNGRIYGHVATWDTCHIAQPMGPGTCVMAPKSKSDYSYFHTGIVRTKEGVDYAVGHITMDTGHAKPKLNVHSASSHYENTGATVADVRAGEDAHGIWIAGALRPDVKASQVRKLRASPLSGDWRTVAGNLELVAALAVNVPGFPVPRPQGLVASGDLSSLTAAGMVVPSEVDVKDSGYNLTASDMEYLKRLADRTRREEREALAQRVRSSKTAMNRRRVEAFATRTAKSARKVK